MSTPPYCTFGCGRPADLNNAYGVCRYCFTAHIQPDPPVVKTSSAATCRFDCGNKALPGKNGLCGTCNYQFNSDDASPSKPAPAYKKSFAEILMEICANPPKSPPTFGTRPKSISLSLSYRSPNSSPVSKQSDLAEREETRGLIKVNSSKKEEPKSALLPAPGGRKVNYQQKTLTLMGTIKVNQVEKESEQKAKENTEKTAPTEKTIKEESNGKTD